ncbi:hypothetical protein G6F56_014394 [Rhizopus delemar]|nr:hypothetical protein G6F56_014394 [Rhizopus delemar]
MSDNTFSTTNDALEQLMTRIDIMVSRVDEVIARVDGLSNLPVDVSQPEQFVNQIETQFDFNAVLASRK